MSGIKKAEFSIKKHVKRRTFIKSGVIASAGALAIGGAGCGRDQVYKADYPVVSENNVRLRLNGKSVLILGGGFGGMHAACELLDRGFKVTILEKSNLLGGKLKSWRDKSFGVPPANDPNWRGYPRDHGAHAVWGFYNNLREFMGRHGYRMWRFPRSQTIYNFLDKDGTNVAMGYPPTWPWPFDQIQMMRRMIKAFSKLSGADPKMIKGALAKMAAFDFDDVKQRMYLDGVSFPEWARSVGMPDSLIYRYFAPASEMAMFDHIDNTSALYMLMLMALAGGHYDDMQIDMFMHPPGETYVEPILKYIKERGGEVLFNTPVIKVNRDGDRIRSVLAGTEGGAVTKGAKTWKCKVCGSVFSSPTKPSRCPVCGAPSSQIIAFSTAPAKKYVADYYVLAMDTPGAKEVISKSRLLGDEYFDNIMKLDATKVYPVNIWYSNCDSWARRFPSYIDFFPSSFKFLGITLNWAHDGVFGGKKLVEPLVPDYQGKNICVIETQIANTERVESLNDDQIARLVHEELKIVMPDLPNPTDYYVNRWDTYSPQRVGYEALRPTIQSPIDNFFIIGDWVRTDHLSVYMEKTNVASKMVTNLILDKTGQKKGKMKVLRSGTPNLMLDINKWLSSVYP